MGSVRTVLSARRAAVRPRRWPIVLVRVLGVLFLAGVFAQAVLAGQFVTGDVDLLKVHAAVGGSLVLLPMAEMAAALALWWFGRGPAWYLGWPPLMFALVVAQVAAGNTRQLALHIPLGASLLALAGWQVAWALRFRRHVGGAA